MATSYYLDLTPNSVQGESLTQQNQVDVLSWSWGGSTTVSAGGVTGLSAGKPNLSDLHLVKNYDKASPQIFKAMVTGQVLKSAVLTGYKTTGQSKLGMFLRLTLTNLLVTSLQDSASSESVSFAYQIVKSEYWTQAADGTLTAAGSITYDLTKNQQS
jgi:type VI secretion system secreted protein Hcp